MNVSRATLAGAVVVSTVAFFGVAGIAVHPAHAESCAVTKDQIAQLAAIEGDPTLTTAQELTQELALRRKLVGRTITCAEAEVIELQTALVSASTTDATGQAVQSQLLGNLNDAANFYDIELQKLNDAGIAGTQAIARDVLSWRKDSLVPLSENVNNFILWSSNQDLFTIARARMDQTQRAVSFLENANANADLQKAFDDANASFTDAENENAAARNALAQRLSPDQSLAFIKQSLSSLSATYQAFFDVSTAIKNIFPQ